MTMTNTVLQGQDAFIFCIINGDKAFFSESLLSLGHAGGRRAAQILTQGILDEISRTDMQVYGALSYWVHCYFNKRDVFESLARRGVCTRDQFEMFLIVRFVCRD